MLSGEEFQVCLDRGCSRLQLLASLCELRRSTCKTEADAVIVKARKHPFVGYLYWLKSRIERHEMHPHIFSGPIHLHSPWAGWAGTTDGVYSVPA